MLFRIPSLIFIPSHESYGILNILATQTHSENIYVSIISPSHMYMYKIRVTINICTFSCVITHTHKLLSNTISKEVLLDFYWETFYSPKVLND